MRDYTDDLAAVRRRLDEVAGYLKVDELRALAGGARLSVDVLAVSSQGGDRGAALPEKQANAMVDALATRLAQLSGHV